MPVPSNRVSVTMPDGQVITDVPVNITQEELWEQYQSHKAGTAGAVVPPRAVTPIAQALAARDQEIAQFQTKAQKDYAARTAALAAYDAANPNDPNRPNPLVAEPRPAVDPDLPQRAPPLAPPEANPKQPMGSGFMAATKAGLVDDPETKKRIIAQNLFPNDPDGIYRVGFDKAGQPVYVGDDNKLHRIASGTAQFGANVVANAPETAAAIIGGLGGPGVAAGLAAGVHGIKRGVAGAYYDEPQTMGHNLASMGIEGGSTLVGEGIGRGLAAAGNAGRRMDFTPHDVAAAEAVRQRVLRNTGINLNLADASDDPGIKGLYAYAMRQPTNAQRVLREDRARSDQQFTQATERVLNSIANPQAEERAGAAATNAAQDALQAARDRAQALADPYYQRAYQSHPRITDPQLMRFFQMPGFGEAFDAGQVTARYQNQALRQYQPPDLRSLDYMKRALETSVNNLAKTDPTQARAMRGQVDAFTRRLDEVSPEYRQARRVYRRAYSWSVKPLEDGKVGTLARIDDPQARTAAAQVLSDTNVSPQMIATTRRVIQAQSPEAWDGIVRQWLASKWDTALERTQSAEVRNRAGKYQQQVFASPRDEEIAQAMLSPQQYHAFNELMFAARRLASTPTGGSSTPHDLQVGDVLEGGTGRIVQALSALRSPVQTIKDAARRRARDQNIMDITNAIVDPTQRRRLNVVMRMRPGTRQALVLGGILSEEAAKRSAQAHLAQGDDSHLIAGDDEDEDQHADPQ